MVQETAVLLLDFLQLKGPVSLGRGNGPLFCFQDFNAATRDVAAFSTLRFCRSLLEIGALRRATGSGREGCSGEESQPFGFIPIRSCFEDFIDSL